MPRPQRWSPSWPTSSHGVSWKCRSPESSPSTMCGTRTGSSNCATPVANWCCDRERRRHRRAGADPPCCTSRLPAARPECPNVDSPHRDRPHRNLPSLPIPHLPEGHPMSPTDLTAPIAVPVNFIRPTFFMENLPGMIARDGAELLVRMPMPGDVPLQMISVKDIGKAAAALLTRREPDTAPVEIAGDEATGERIAQLVAQRFGAAATYVQVPLDVLGSNDDLKSMLRWFATPPSFRADFARTRSLVPDVENLPRWLARQPDFG